MTGPTMPSSCLRPKPDTAWRARMHSHQFVHWPFADAHNTASFSTTKVVREHLPVLLVSHDADGAWQFLDATTDEPGEALLVCMACIYEGDQSLEQIADLPLGWSAWRQEVGGTWERAENPPEDDDEDAGNAG